MRVVITGATGFIGRALCRDLQGDYEVVALSRDSRKATDVLGSSAKVVEWDGRTTSGWARQVEGARAIVNLAGENVATGRWTLSKRDSIAQSRANAAKAIVNAVEGARKKPEVVLHGSAIGYYGPWSDESCDETSPVGGGFLAEVCRKAEAIAKKAEVHGARSVILRTGVVLGPDGGALPKLMRPFRFFVGGHVGSGGQWFSWISLRDEIRAIRFLIENDDQRGVFNLTAPNPVTMTVFCRTLGNVLGRPSWTVMPGFVLRLAFGAMADEVFLASQHVIPKRLMETDFEFEHTDALEALDAIIRGERNESE